MEPKKYGLITFNSKKVDNKKTVSKVLGKASAQFNDDDSDDDSGFVMPIRNTLKRQDQAQISQAIEDDPNVYEYDEVYDEMKGTDSKKDGKVS